MSKVGNTKFLYVKSIDHLHAFLKWLNNAKPLSEEVKKRFLITFLSRTFTWYLIYNKPVLTYNKTL